ncbi:hypothetical protein IFM89_026147 [Coptis chinensis]|uniref:phospholipase D n=1 Tax=Coptis chinensis TaxID=261450 RepID=A0A835IFZ9_9MAGN|nr:hypothetical protein IFM89_026147 [Coptis chinensis]
MALILLHGTLHVTILEANSVSNPGRATGGAPKFLRKLVENIEETVGIGKGATKLYATIDLERARVGRTRILQDEPANPHDNPIGATNIGRAYLPVKELLDGQEVDRWLEILNEDRKPVHGGAKIHVKLQYFDVTLDRNWARGIRSPKYPGVPYTFFAQRNGCKVSLYQDAHVPENFVPKIPLAGERWTTAHHDDFHQPNFTGASISKRWPKGSPGMIFIRLEGPIAWDVLYNFEQRWRKQAKAGLVSGKDNIIDRSIQDGYINAIRRAKNFIYIENQYFLGSSFGWKSDGINVNDVGALHIIPKELSLKIVSKIEAGERFVVYVVVPMWPEGIPESASVQAILDWQRRTMEMMYTDITEALKSKGIQANPKDYLTFFCLGNREVKKEGEYMPSEKPEPDTDYSRAQEARRFMIYVHTKMMIVDDEYIIIGSANINQRSMDGSRDSEIAMGACQPYHLSTREPARGQIHGFRMSLWYEHLGMLDDSFLKPDSLECIQKVNAVSSKYWDLYSSETLDHDLPGHLLSYPIGVTYDGVVTELPGTEFFPDTKARVLGTKSDFLPPILTT